MSKRRVGQLWAVGDGTYYVGKHYILLKKINCIGGARWEVMIEGEEGTPVVWDADEMKSDKLIAEAK